MCFVLGILSVPVWAFSGFINLHPLGRFMSLPSRSSGVFQYQSLLCVLGSSGELGDAFSTPCPLRSSFPPQPLPWLHRVPLLFSSSPEVQGAWRLKGEV